MLHPVVTEICSGQESETPVRPPARPPAATGNNNNPKPGGCGLKTGYGDTFQKGRIWGYNSEYSYLQLIKDFHNGVSLHDVGYTKLQLICLNKMDSLTL